MPIQRSWWGTLEKHTIVRSRSAPITLIFAKSFWCDICVVYFSVCIPTYNACKNQNICGGKVPQKSIFRSLYRHPYFWSLSLAQALLSTIEWVIKQSFLRRFQRAGFKMHLKVGGARSRCGCDIFAPESLETAEGSSNLEIKITPTVAK